MARKYVNPNIPGVTVTDDLVGQAQDRAKAAAERLRQAERADPTRPGWDAEYDAASAELRAAGRRLEALERLRAAQVERGGKRADAVQAAAGDLEAAAAGLAASRDRVAAAATAHLKALAALSAAADAHNRLLAGCRAKAAAAGLQVRDDLLAEGQEHAEGILEGGGLRAGGTDWIPVLAGALESHALRLVFAGFSQRHPLARIGKYQFRPHEVEARADGLRVPSLKDAGVKAAPAPAQAAVPARPSVRDLAADPGAEWKPSMMKERV